VVDSDTVRLVFEAPGDGGAGGGPNPLIPRFLALTRLMKSVICARVSPDQKAQVVRAVRRHDPGTISLAVGDGANDVPMIQCAHVGVGIFGEEGLQAANSADYAVARFRFLRRLVLAHGRWCNRRMGILICYMFYKNALMVLPQYYFAFFSLASGQNVYVEYPLYQGYNVAFTAFAVFAFAIMDRDVSPTMAFREPSLYRRRFLDRRRFWAWMAEGFAQSFVCTMVPLLALENWGGGGAVSSADGKSHGIWYLGAAIHFNVVVVATLRLCIEVREWTWIYVGTIAFNWFLYWLSFFIFSSSFSMSASFASVGAVGLMGHLFRDAAVWWSAVLASTCCVVPVFTARACEALFYPRAEQVCAEMERYGAYHPTDGDGGDRGTAFSPDGRQPVGGGGGGGGKGKAKAAAVGGSWGNDHFVSNSRDIHRIDVKSGSQSGIEMVA